MRLNINYTNIKLQSIPDYILVTSLKLKTDKPS